MIFILLIKLIFHWSWYVFISLNNFYFFVVSMSLLLFNVLFFERNFLWELPVQSNALPWLNIIYQATDHCYSGACAFTFCFLLQTNIYHRTKKLKYKISKGAFEVNSEKIFVDRCLIKMVLAIRSEKKHLTIFCKPQLLFFFSINYYFFLLYFILSFFSITNVIQL